MLKRFTLFFIAGLILAYPHTSCLAEPQLGTHYFYKEREYGSDSQFNPITASLNYTLDTLQVPASFDDEDFEERLEEVLENLGDPFHAISQEGSYRDFVNRQVYPVDWDNIEESVEILPNYGLHVIGGGMIYRKQAEWLDARGYRFPRLYSAAAGTISEILQEAIEKKSTRSDDEVADVYLFRPLGMLLFNFDTVSDFFANTMRLRSWPYQPTYSFGEARFINAGDNFISRPAFFGSEKHRPFFYFGLTTLLGSSHELNPGESISWGAGVAMEKAERDEVEVRPSGGIFFDRNDSLLASIIVNTTDQLAVRGNVYPGIVGSGFWSPGVYLGVRDDGDVQIGISFRALPLGVSEAIE